MNKYSESNFDYISKEDFDRINKFADNALPDAEKSIGYPVTQFVYLHEFEEWFCEHRLDTVLLDNAGDPFDPHISLPNTLNFEREVVEECAPLYGFTKEEVWGLCSNSGTDGNLHGTYFGKNYLKSVTGQLPVVYLSSEAHYSNMRLCELQNLEMRIIPSSESGCMNLHEFDRAIDALRPALVIVAMGTTFKGGIDDMSEIHHILDKKRVPGRYLHVDAALFGGYLPFTQHKWLVDAHKNRFDSIAISGHKFFGMNEPAGLFMTTKKVLEAQTAIDIPYLNGAMPMVNCSRSSITPLKFWWLMRRIGAQGYNEQAEQILKYAEYMKGKLDAVNYPCWLMPYSNTVFFKRPSQAIMDKWGLAPEFDERFGGELAHVVVMQHVSKGLIDALIEDMTGN